MYFRFFVELQILCPALGHPGTKSRGLGAKPSACLSTSLLAPLHKTSSISARVVRLQLKNPFMFVKNFWMAVKLAAFSLPKHISCMFLANSFVTILPFSNFQFCISAKMVQSKKNDFIAAQTHILLQPYFNPATQILTGIKCLPLH